MTAFLEPFENKLDLVTLGFSVAMFAFLLAALTRGSAASALAQGPALRAWTWAMAAAGGGFLLQFLRGDVPQVLSFALAHLLLLLTPVLGAVAYLRLLEVTVPRKLITGLLAASIGLALAYRLLGTPLLWALLMISLTGTTLCAVMAWHLLRHALAHRSPAAAVGATVMALTTLSLVLRAVAGVRATPEDLLAGLQRSTTAEAVLAAGLFVVGGSMAFFALMHERQRQTALEGAQRDALTGLYTRGAFFDLAAKQFTPPSYDAAVAVLMIDIDHFKAINDTHGHRAGDQVLAHVARRIAGLVRLTDLVGRYGGEEFCALLPACSPAEAEELAQRIVADARRQRVRLPQGREVRYTLSAGCCSTRLQAGDTQPPLSELIELADQALYASKRQGRDQASPTVWRHHVSA
jgi:diguanylate cyclase (GGDEF)-like protein